MNCGHQIEVPIQYATNTRTLCLNMRTIKPASKWIYSGKQAAFYRFECIRINKVNPLLIGNPPLKQSLMIFPVAFNIHCTEFVLHLAITPALIKGTPVPNG